MADLDLYREKLMKVLPVEIWNAQVHENWPSVRQLIDDWWRSYKRWEKQDTFNTAFQEGRMSIRSFSNDFDWEKNKQFNKIDMPVNRIFADSNYKALPRNDQFRHNDIFRGDAEGQKYHAQRGIDSSAFANPANFASRDTKYEAGLHDLSASLLDPKVPIFDQIHHKADMKANFSFLPLSPEEDQYALYTLFCRSKQEPNMPTELTTMVRDYRARMTRIKLAQDSDMAIGYTAVPAPREGSGPQYKLRYGLGARTTVTGNAATIPTTLQLLNARREDALNFKRILGRGGKNEIIIAMRQHEGDFPVLAARDGRMMKCYSIVGGQQKFNGKTIFANGRMND